MLKSGILSRLESMIKTMREFKHRETLLTVIAIATAFLLGWSMRGDHIYSQMFNNMSYLSAQLPVTKK